MVYTVFWAFTFNFQSLQNTEMLVLYGIWLYGVRARMHCPFFFLYRLFLYRLFYHFLGLIFVYLNPLSLLYTHILYRYFLYLCLSISLSRDSKIGQLLRDSLGNLSCRSCMIAHVSPHAHSYNETLQVIQLAARIHRMKRRRIKVTYHTDRQAGRQACKEFVILVRQ